MGKLDAMPIVPLQWPAGRRPREDHVLVWIPLTASVAAVTFVIQGRVALAAVAIAALLCSVCARRLWYRPALREIGRQLKARPATASDIWVDSAHREVADALAAVISKEARWPNARFVKDDPLDVLLFCPLGDGGAGLAITDVIARLSGGGNWKSVGRWWERGTFGALVDYVVAKRMDKLRTDVITSQGAL